MMRARVSDPVVEILHQSCGVCSQMITSQDFVRANAELLFSVKNVTVYCMHQKLWKSILLK